MRLADSDRLEGVDPGFAARGAFGFEGFFLTESPPALRPSLRRVQDSAESVHQLIGQAGLRDDEIAPRLTGRLGVLRQGVSGQDDDWDRPGAGITLQSPRRLPAIHHGQRQIHDDDVREKGRGFLQGFLSILGLRDAEAREFEEQHVDRPIVLDIVHDEHEGARVAGDWLARAPFGRPFLERHRRFDPTGMINVNVEPWRSLLWSVIRPPRTVASRRQIASPRPVPPVCRVGTGSAWENASKIRAWSASAMPMPVSATAIAISRLARRYVQDTVTEPRRVNLSAFVSRFRRTCLTFCRSLRRSGKPSGTLAVTSRFDVTMRGSTSLMISSISSFILIAEVRTGILPASMREMSRIS